MSINYRVDALPSQPAGTDYKVPCGMNTIIWSSDKQPNILTLTKLIAPMLNAGFVGVLSEYQGAYLVSGGFKVTSIIKAG